MYAKRKALCAVVVSLLCLAVHARGAIAADAQQQSFGEWLKALQQEALSKGISKATLEKSLSGVAPLEKVIALDRNQPELKQSLGKYLGRVVTAGRVKRGRLKLKENRMLLAMVKSHYGVQPRFLIALWAIETDFGGISGDFPVIPALATLAYDPRRSAYFREELFYALRILDGGRMSHDRMKGSWAGAMGQLQFMPSVFHRYAVDFNGDGRFDIWGQPGDFLATGANFLSRSGWQPQQTWGQEVRLPPKFNQRLIDSGMRVPLGTWHGLGVRPAGAWPFRDFDVRASVIQPDGPQGRSFVVFDNYQALLTWNRSHKFAVGVGMLADRIGEQ